MKFILETQAEEKSSTYNCVEINQFFVTVGGELCQKLGSLYYNMVALKDGTPCRLLHFAPAAPNYSDIHQDFIINRILPKVLKIEF